MRTGKITKEENEFCEEIDWHPVDELPMKEEHKKEMERARKGPSSEPSLLMSYSEINSLRWLTALIIVKDAGIK